MDKIGKGGVAKEAVTGVDRILKTAYLAVDVLLDSLDFRCEVCEHLLIDVLIEHADNLTADVLLCQFSFFIGEFNVSFSHILHVARRVDKEYLLALFIRDPLIVYLMIVPEEDDVETRNLVSYSRSSVLFIILCDDATVFARVEQAEEQIRFLGLLYVFHPFLGATYHLLKLNAFPDGFVQPIRDSRCDHTDDTDLYAILIVDRVGVKPMIDMIRVG